MKRKGNGEGTIFKRKDGRWSAQTYITLNDGTRKRICITYAERKEVKDKLDEITAQEKKSIPFSGTSWTVSTWLDYWLAEIIPSRVRQKTILAYEKNVRLYIKPQIGKIQLEKLSVHDVQGVIDRLQKSGCGVRTIHMVRQTLSSALGRAMRQEIVFRNVARLVDLPEYRPKQKQLWTVEETQKFLSIAKGHRWYAGYLMMLNYGLRN